MQAVLIPHPDSRLPAVDRIEVAIARPRRRRFDICFVLTGRLADLRLPAPAAPARTEGLWRHTCFEVFLRSAGDAYYEFNLSPSGAWAAYGFDGYRTGMRPLEDIAAPRITTEMGDDRFVLETMLELDGCADLPVERPWRVGLSAVIEAADGTVSYWALAHPPGKPDFHRADCFAGEVAAPGAA